MSANLSTAKANALLTRVQLNPEINTADAAYCADLVQRAAEDFVSAAHLPRYPELAQGYAVSAASPGTDITALATSSFLIDVNGSGLQEIDVEQSGNDTGAEIAAAMQTAIRASTVDGFDEVTVAYASSLYTITSGRYGEGSSICVRFNEDKKHLCQALKLSELYGATEVKGGKAREEADDLVVEMVEILYRKLGLEGSAIGGSPGDSYFNMFADELSPAARRKLNSMRRLW